MGFVWAVRDREVGVVREAHQGGEEGVGCVGRVILLNCEGQWERHEKVQEGARKGVRPAPVRTVYLRVRM